MQVNTLGCRACRPAYRAALVAWGQAHAAGLCADCLRRLEQNPLRLLDCKQAGCAALRDGAPPPRMVEHACAACAAHFARVQELLAGQGVTLDYITRQGWVAAPVTVTYRIAGRV